MAVDPATGSVHVWSDDVGLDGDDSVNADDVDALAVIHDDHTVIGVITLADALTRLFPRTTSTPDGQPA